MTDHSSQIYTPENDADNEPDVHAAQTSFFPAISGGMASASNFRQQRTGRPYPDVYYEPDLADAPDYYQPNYYYSQLVPVQQPRRANPMIGVVKVMLAMVALAMLGALAFYATTLVRNGVNTTTVIATATPVTVYPTYDSGNVQGTMTAAAAVVVTFAPTQAPVTAPNMIATVTQMPTNTAVPANITIAATATPVATATRAAILTAVPTSTPAPTETLPPLFTDAPATQAPVVTVAPKPTKAPPTSKPATTPPPTKAKATKAAALPTTAAA